MLRLKTRRLELIATTAEIAAADARERAQRGSAARLQALLGAEIPADWPPALLDDHLEQFAAALEKGGPELVGWWGWYVVRNEAGAARVLVGSAGMMAPTENGDCVLGYSVLPAFWRSGYASEALGALLDWAAASGRVRRFIGYTYPHLIASVRVLEKNGFLYCGAGEEPGTIRFERRA